MINMGNKEPDNVELDEKAYHEFIELLNKGEANDSYRVFEKRPGLVGYMSLCEIPTTYANFRRYVGVEKSELFSLVVAKDIMDICESLSGVDALCELTEAELDEKLEEHLGKNYKKWLRGELGEFEEFDSD